MSNHKSFVIWHIETSLIPWGDSQRLYDVLKYIREQVRVQFCILSPCFFVFKCLHLLGSCCTLQAIDTSNGMYNIYKWILNR